MTFHSKTLNIFSLTHPNKMLLAAARMSPHMYRDFAPIFGSLKKYKIEQNTILHLAHIQLFLISFFLLIVICKRLI